MNPVLLVLVTGVPVGVTYALIGYAFTLAYKSSGVFNFAIGQIAIVGALVYISLAGVLPVSLAFLGALAVLVAAGPVVYFGLLRRPETQGADPVTLIMITLGLGIVVQNGTPSIWGYYALESPPLVAGGVNVGGLFIDAQRVVLVVAATLVLGALYAFERATMMGKALLAAGINREAAILAGVNDRLIQALAWGISFALAALAAILFTPLASAAISSAGRFAVFGFSAALVGGLGSSGGALIGGVALGLLGSVIGVTLTTQFADAIVFALVIGFLLVRPAGLFGDPKLLLGPRA